MLVPVLMIPVVRVRLVAMSMLWLRVTVVPTVFATTRVSNEVVAALPLIVCAAFPLNVKMSPLPTMSRLPLSVMLPVTVVFSWKVAVLPVF